MMEVYSERNASASGECGRSLDLPIGSAVVRQRYCAGNEPEYQLDLSGSGPNRAVVLDLQLLGEIADVRH